MDSCFQTFKADVWSMIIFVIVTAPIFLTLMKTRGRIVMRILADNYIYVWGIYCQQGLSGNCNTEIRSGIFSHETSLFQNFQPSSRWDWLSYRFSCRRWSFYPLTPPRWPVFWQFLRLLCLSPLWKSSLIMGRTN